MSADKDIQIRIISDKFQPFTSSFYNLASIFSVFSVLLVLSLLLLSVSFFTITTLIALGGSRNDHVAFGFKPTPPPNKGSVTTTSPPDQTSSKYHFITKWGSEGSGDGQFRDPDGIAVDSSGNVYVADDMDNHRIQKFNSNGKFITKWGSPGKGDGQFDRPSAIAFDSTGNMYVSEFGNSRIQKFAPDT